MYYDKIRHRHSQVLAATGLTPAEFDALLITFKYHWDEYYSHFTLEGKVRQRISYNSVVSDSGQNVLHIGISEDQSPSGSRKESFHLPSSSASVYQNLCKQL